MRRVVVLGSPGSGKSVLATHIARAHGLRWVEADALRWGPCWSRIPDSSYVAKLTTLTRENDWIVEGVYPEVLALAANADLVVWLDLPLRVVLWRVTRRSVLRSMSGELVCGENRERLRSLLGRNSMPVYVLRIHHANRRQIARAARLRIRPERLLRFTSTAQVNAWLSVTTANTGKPVTTRD